MVKKIVFILTIIGVCFLGVGNPLAQTKYPEKPIEALLGYAAGASADIASRVVAEFLTKTLGQNVIIVNKPGGAGSVAGNALFDAKPDGYTMAMFNTSQSHPEVLMNPERFLYKSKDVQVVAQWTGWIPGVFVRYDAPWNSVSELVEYAKANPDTLRWGHSGRGNAWWIIGSVFIQQKGLKMMDVPFEGDGQNLTALLGQHVDMSVLTCGGSVIAQIEAKKVKPLFLVAPERNELLPGVPTAKEAGVALDIGEIYLGAFVPKKTPPEIVSKLSEAIKKVSGDPEYKERMKKIWFPIWYRDTKEFEELIEKDSKAVGKYSKQLGIN